MSLDQHGLRKLRSFEYSKAKTYHAIAASAHHKGNNHSIGQPGPCTTARRDNISYSRKLTEKILCAHCDKHVDPGNYNQYHGENCKLNPNVDTAVLQKRSKTSKDALAKAISRGTHKHRSPTSFGDIVCPHCNKVGTNMAAMKRFHFDKCEIFTGAKHKSLNLPKCCCYKCHREFDIANFSKHSC